MRRKPLAGLVWGSNISCILPPARGEAPCRGLAPLKG
nr:MAG TPA: hypothetical protein [Caudoviricetes sp.]